MRPRSPDCLRPGWPGRHQSCSYDVPAVQQPGIHGNARNRREKSRPAICAISPPAMCRAPLIFRAPRYGSLSFSGWYISRKGVQSQYKACAKGMKDSAIVSDSLLYLGAISTKKGHWVLPDWSSGEVIHDACELDDVAHLKLAHHVHAVQFHRAHGDTELFGNIPVQGTGRYHFGNLQLAR